MISRCGLAAIWRIWQKRANSFAAMSVLLTGDATMGGQDAAQVRVAGLSDSLTRLFGIVPALGRDFLPHEFDHAPQAPGLRASAENRSDTGIAVLSDRIFRRRLGGDPGILGKSVVIVSFRTLWLVYCRPAFACRWPRASSLVSASKQTLTSSSTRP